MTRRVALLAALALPLSPGVAVGAMVNLSESPCLQPPAQVSKLTPASARFRAEPGRTYDARGQMFTYGGVAVIEQRNASGNTCLVGPTIVGPIGPEVSWSSRLKPDGIQHSRPTGPYRVHGASIRRVNDALSPPKALDTPRSVRFSYRDVYAREIRDDLLENDACLGGEIRDSLFDGVHMGFSERPGAKNRIDLGPTMPVVTVANTMIRLECQTDVRGGTGCPGKTSHGQWWKLSHGKCQTADGRIGPRYVLDNVIFRTDETGTAGISGIRMPEPERLLTSNVTVLYPGPGKVPPMPPGVTVVRDRAKVERTWNEARAKWLADHGCDQNGDNCAYLRTPDVPLPPEPKPISSSRD
jgi:hypothetical protein